MSEPPSPPNGNVRHLVSLDRQVVFNNTEVEVTFTKAARKHKVGRARVLEILRNPRTVFEDPLRRDNRWVVLGDDATGRAIELIVAVEGRELTVLHAMDLRRKYRALYEMGMS